MVRDDGDNDLIEQLDGIIAVIYQHNKPHIAGNDIQCFHMEDPSAISYIVKHLKEEGVCLDDLS